ncbi:MAG: hypothetical protein CMH21_13445 [Methylophaga sp.]|uniref:hypothetical protein n=2 Tax=unclassified Methylophaga TaxID=2629249 RepID=UPI000C8FC5CC|nr:MULTISPECIES: hypothetical protein [unclassified Methylophaga]MAK67491.1 hypothetical protein [Methylophaga sp.]MAY18724.1 hypothetical protein [Methylophaga sp.]HAO25028.1 hypothetical protein [Methylophaga sp.]HCD04485.1 hypothetical protein [Methylophaga sp.]
MNKQGVSMALDKQKRSCMNEMKQKDQPSDGVGARNEGVSPAQQGGRYLDICTDFEVSEKNFRDPRIDDLSKVGINGKWRGLAQQLGFDVFIVAWNHLSMLAETGDDGHRVYVPQFEVFMRFQRNRYIMSLHNDGYKPRQIHDIVARDLGENVHTSHISRIIRQNTG